MEKNVLVSIIIAAYNSEKYIANCIESVLNQTYERFELIIIDDGSTDNTRTICEKYKEKDCRIIYIYQDNQGVGEARNNGVKNMSGDFVSFIDSDDEISCKYLECLLEPCIKDNVDIAACMYQYVDEGKKYNPTITNTYKVSNINCEILQAKIIARCCGTIINTNLVKNEYFDTDVYVGEDLLFLCKAINKARKMSITMDQLYCYYIYKESSYNGTYNDKKFTEVISWNRVIKLFEDRPKDFRNTISHIYAWIVLSNVLKMEEFHYNDKGKKEYCLRELRKMKGTIFSQNYGGDNVNIAMYFIYLLTCISPYIGYKMFHALMKLKHKICALE